ncbi:MliC family protein [Neisseriaceae bacterium TC5R-5]|nr:MliC family protein [Neisseriaceae bacterium TC5R-5]
MSHNGAKVGYCLARATLALSLLAAPWVLSEAKSEKGGERKTVVLEDTLSEGLVKPILVIATDFDCDRPREQVETMVCQNSSLMQLDNRLQKVYLQAMALADASRPTASNKLANEQQRWVRGLNDCARSEAMHICLGDAYILRISQLQATWGLAPALRPLLYLCQGQPKRTVLATFYRTHPGTAKLEYGGNTVILHQGVDGNTAHYSGKGVEFWLKGREASLNWRGEVMDCLSQADG